MGFPTSATVKLFLEEIKKRGSPDLIFESYSDSKNVKKTYIPCLAVLQHLLLALTETPKGTEEASPFFVGFMCAFDLFRRQIEAEDMNLGDIEADFGAIQSWNKFLEDENCKLKARLEELEDGISK